MSASASLRNVSHGAWLVWRRNADVARTTWLTNVLPPLLEPVLYVLAFGFGVGSLIDTVEHRGRDLPYLEFMAPGVICMAVMFWSFFEMTFSSFVRMYYQRTFDAIVATPLLVEDVIAGEWLWGATKSVFAGTTILGILSLFGLVAWPWGLFVVPLTALGGILFASVGLIATSRARTIDSFNLPVFLLIFPMFLFSGTFFPLEILPAPLHAVAMALPLTHLAVLVRGACLGDFPTAWPASLAYLIVVSGVLSVAALVLMKRRLVK